MSEDNARPPRISEVVSDKLWPDLPKIRADDWGDIDFELHEIKFLNGDNGEYAVTRCKDPQNGSEFTMALSGVVVIKKLRALESQGPLPVTVRRWMRGHYWDLG